MIELRDNRRESRPTRLDGELYLRIILSLAAFSGDLENVFVRLLSGDLNGDSLSGELKTGFVGVFGGDRLLAGGGRVGVSLSLRLTGVSFPSRQGSRRSGVRAWFPVLFIMYCRLQLLGRIGLGLVFISVLIPSGDCDGLE